MHTDLRPIYGDGRSERRLIIENLSVVMVGLALLIVAAQLAPDTVGMATVGETIAAIVLSVFGVGALIDTTVDTVQAYRDAKLTTSWDGER